ncbi:sigma 54-interacting transcriptional regulator [Brevibacillus marinus]|uniref:sigma-54 interaction domain-containing protein n=1 Tax=Brevibacillus marinus TaxID=2496837 RepID=UPI000F81BB01
MARMERRRLLQEVEGLLSLIHEPVLVIDAAGKVVHANQAAEQVWKYSQIILVNKTLPDLVASANLYELTRRGKPLRDCPVEIIDATGCTYPYACLIHPLFVERKVEGAILQFTKRVWSAEGEKNCRYVPRYSFADIRGNSPNIVALKEQALQVAKSDSTILIRGESGTGKEVLAQAIHQASPRRQGPFVAINCAAIPESLLESELFGYEEGAFTGAKKGGKPGRFELAKGGTLFLDEIGDMPLHLQAKLLRVLQERRIERIGGAESIRVDVRVIAATHKDLETMIVRQQFREDLFFRLNVIPLYVPPLRERKEDLYDLIQFYMKWFGQRLGKEPKRFSASALKALFAYHWPGNIRELENVIEYIVNLEIGDLVTVSSLPASIRQAQAPETEAAGEMGPVRARQPDELPELAIRKSEEHLILQALSRYGKSTEGKKKAARALGISLATLYRRLAKLKQRTPSQYEK